MQSNRAIVAQDAGTRVGSSASDVDRIISYATDHHIKASTNVDIVTIIGQITRNGCIKCTDHCRLATICQYFQLALVTMHEVATATHIDVIDANAGNHIIGAIAERYGIIATNTQVDGFN